MPGPFDLYGDDELAADAQARAMAEALRRRQSAGMLFTLLGGPFAPAGRALSEQAQDTGLVMHRAGVGRALLSRQRAQAAQDEAWKQKEYGLRARGAERADAQAAAQAARDEARLRLERQKFEAGEKVEAPKPDYKTTDSLRQEFQGQQGYKDFQQVAAAYKKILGTSDTGAGDISLIYGYMKLVDPGSTVREGEFATAASAGSVPDKVWGLYNRVLKGERLPPEVRQQFKSEAGTVYKAQRERFDALAGPYRTLAEKRGADPTEVVFDPGMDVQSAPTASTTVKMKLGGKVKAVPAEQVEFWRAKGAVEVE